MPGCGDGCGLGWLLAAVARCVVYLQKGGALGEHFEGGCSKAAALGTGRHGSVRCRCRPSEPIGGSRGDKVWGEEWH